MDNFTFVKTVDEPAFGKSPSLLHLAPLTAGLSFLPASWYGWSMAKFEYKKSDLPEVSAGPERTLHDGAAYRTITSGSWSMEWISPARPDDGDSSLEDVDKTILAWIAYRAWLEKNPPLAE